MSIALHASSVTASPAACAAHDLSVLNVVGLTANTQHAPGAEELLSAEETLLREDSEERDESEDIEDSEEMLLSEEIDDSLLAELSSEETEEISLLATDSEEIDVSLPTEESEDTDESDDSAEEESEEIDESLPAELMEASEDCALLGLPGSEDGALDGPSGLGVSGGQS